jgi:Tol biopolymer transport system component
LAAILMLAASCARLQTNPSKPASSPGPRTAIALSVLDGSIYLVDPETGVQSTIVADLGDFREGYAAWSPDHMQLAYGNHGLYLLDFHTNKARLLVAGEGMSMPAWSPSGQVIAYGNGSSLWITPLSEARPFQVHIPATLAPVGMNWNSDAIAFQGIRRDCNRSYLCPTTDDSDIWSVQTDATQLVRITHLKRAQSPRWSPDGESILFVRLVSDAVRELWVIGADGSHPRQLGTAEDVVAADWSPDGKRIVMARRGLEGATLRLWITDASGVNGHPVGGMVRGKEATVDW